MEVPEILERGPVPVPTIRGRGRRRGSGYNCRLIKNLRPGDALMNISLNRKDCIRTAAHRMGIKIKVRMMPDSDKLYMIFLK